MALSEPALGLTWQRIDLCRDGEPLNAAARGIILHRLNPGGVHPREHRPFYTGRIRKLPDRPDKCTRGARDRQSVTVDARSRDSGGSHGLPTNAGARCRGRDDHAAPACERTTTGRRPQSRLARERPCRGSGSTVGPEGALCVTEPLAGRVSRVDPRTGAVTTFASGLPPTIPDVGVGGAMDVAFIGSTAHVLVTLVGTDVATMSLASIEWTDRTRFPSSQTSVNFRLQNPPSTAFFVPTGVQYEPQSYRGDSWSRTDITTVCCE